jgi:tetratricopeptide (TPR) repeat protein
MKFAKPGLFLLFFFNVLVFNVETNAQQTATDFFKISQKAFQYKDYDNVIFFTNKAIELNPDYGAAYWNRAIAYDCKGEYQKSIADYSKAIQLYDNDVDRSVLLKNRGMVFNTIKEYDSAILDFNRSILLKPDYSFAWWNKGISFDGLKKYDSAIAAYSKAMQYFQPGNDLAQLYLSRGIDYKNLGDKDKSTPDFKKVLDITEPGYYNAYALYMLGDEKKARESINKSLQNVKSAKTEAAMQLYFDAAAIFAVMNDVQECMKYMELAFKNGYNDFQFISKDKDFENVRDRGSFKELMRRYQTK